MGNYILLKFEGGIRNEYPIEEERIDAEKERLDRIIGSERNGKNKVKFGKDITLINTKLLSYEIVQR
ncbi:hypothetical protein [Peribacillus butanolivorans]